MFSKQHLRTLLKTLLTPLLLSTVCSLLSTPYPIALAQDPNYDQINEIAKKLNCPTCVGINLADCRTQTCEQWRDQIRDLLKQGYTSEEVVNYFMARYGDQVLQEPPKSGWTLALWTGPLVMLALGGLLLLVVLRRWRKQKPALSFVVPAKTAAVEAPSNYLRQVEQDLHSRNNEG